MKPRTKKIIAFTLLAAAVIGIGVGIYFIFIDEPDPSWRIRSINAGTFVPYDLSASRLYVNSNGTFEIEVIETIGNDRTIMFTGVGTYKRNGSTYSSFEFQGFYYTENGINPPELRQEGRRIVFDTPWGHLYYFGR